MLDKIEDLLIVWEEARGTRDEVSAEELCRECPELLPALKRGIAELQATDWLFGANAPTNDAGALSPRLPRQLGEYELLDCIGTGGMGTVYKARHRRLGKFVALKLVVAGRTWDQTALLRFSREMRALGMLEHPHIVPAYDAGEVDGVQYLTMQLVDGRDAETLLRKHSPIPIADACEIVRQAAIGLQHAHEHELIHRDIKPSNLMIGRDGVVKVLDLGLARLADPPTNAPSAPPLSQAGRMVGTLDYMAPEQFDDSHAADARADIYSLGATLYALLAGGSMFAETQPQSTMHKLAALANQRIAPLGERRAEVNQELSAVVQRMLSRDPGARYGSMKEVAAAVLPFTVGADLRRLVDSEPQETISARTASTRSKSDPRRTQPPIRPLGWLLATALLGLIAWGGILLTLQTPQGEVVVEIGDDVPSDVARQIRVEVQGNRELKIIDQTKNWVIKVKEGTYEVQINGDDDKLELHDKRVTVTRDQKAIVKVTLRPTSPTPVKPPQPTPPPSTSLTQLPIRFQKKITSKMGVDNLLFTPDSKQLLIAGDGLPVIILDAVTGEEVRRLEGFDENSRAMVLLPDDKTLIADDRKGNLRLHDITSGKVVRELASLGQSARAISLSPSGNQIAIAALGQAQLIDIESGKSERIGINAYQCDFDRDGRSIWFSVHLGGLQCWDLATKKVEHPLVEFVTSNGYLVVRRASNEGFYVQDNGRVAVIDLTERKVSRVLETPPGDSFRLAVDNRLVVSRWFKSAHLYSLTADRSPLEFSIPGGAQGLQLAPDGRTLAVGTVDGQIVVLSLSGDMP